MSVLTSEGRIVATEILKRKGGANDRVITVDGRRVVTLPLVATIDLIEGIRAAVDNPVLGLNPPVAVTGDGRDVALFVDGHLSSEPMAPGKPTIPMVLDKLTICVGDRDKPRRVLKIDRAHVIGLLAMLAGEAVPAAELVADRTQEEVPTVRELLTTYKMALDPDANPWDYPEDLAVSLHIPADEDTTRGLAIGPGDYYYSPDGLLPDPPAGEDDPIYGDGRVHTPLLKHGIVCPTCGGVDG